MIRPEAPLRAPDVPQGAGPGSIEPKFGTREDEGGGTAFTAPK